MRAVAVSCDRELPPVDLLDQRSAFAQSVISGLSRHPRTLSCRYLYDAAGSALFERITGLEEYYLTRAETEILAANSERIRALVGPGTLVELGAGSATKTRLLLQAWLAKGGAHYVPIDISGEHLTASCEDLRRAMPAVRVDPLVGTYEQSLAALSDFSPWCLLFLGSSIGNFDRRETEDLWRELASAARAGDHVLIGIDLVKDPETLERAYNDEAGVTAAFIRNLFARMNRELGCSIDLAAIEHVAYYNAEREQMELYARFTRPQLITLAGFEQTFRIAPGEMVLVEISRKFTPDGVSRTARRHHFLEVERFVDSAQRFGVLLFRRSANQAVSDGRSSLRRDLAATRAMTLRIIEPLSDAALVGQHSPLMSPIVWDLGHIANYEEQWVSRALGAGRRFDREAARNDGLYDAVRHPRVRRAELALLDRTRALEFLAEIRLHTELGLRKCAQRGDQPLVKDSYVFHMIAQHEAQHAETMLQAVQLLQLEQFEPYWREDPNPVGRSRSEVLVPAGTFRMGSDDRVRAYDNERPAHLVELASYFIDALPVTNGQFLSFLEDGGYRRPELWSTRAREWLRSLQDAHPMQWRRNQDGGWSEVHFGRRQPLALDQPVVHVCWFEADAFARWAGKRLPTEAEWEKAAAWDLERATARTYPWGEAAPDGSLANLGQCRFAPSAAGAYPASASYYGCEQMIGDVWEWTASDFAPYPGFEMFPYPEYSAIHFGKGYKVLRGGSWATNPVAIRNTFRNWDYPQRRQLFAGFRCARDA